MLGSNEMSKTEKDLMDAFAGESQANRRYLAYSQRAEDEFLHGVAKLFRAIAEAETIHAIKHLRTADRVKSTKENLADAIAGETHEFKNDVSGNDCACERGGAKVG